MINYEFYGIEEIKEAESELRKALPHIRKAEQIIEEVLTHKEWWHGSSDLYEWVEDTQSHILKDFVRNVIGAELHIDDCHGKPVAEKFKSHSGYITRILGN